MAVSEKTTTEMTVTVSTDLAAMVQARVASGRYADPSGVVGEALREMDERARQLERLRALVQEGLDSGPAVALTDELWDEIWQEADERLARGEQTSGDGCP